MSNYPPGVSGLEYAIAGATSRGGDTRLVAHECPEDKFEEAFSGDVEGELESYEYEVWFCYECPQCGETVTIDLDPEDFGPDPDVDRFDQD